MSDMTLSLTETVGAVRLLSRHVATDILTIGRHLLNARAVLGKGFPRWIEQHFAFGLRDVARMIRVAAVFAAVPKPTLDRFDPTALYALAERSAPPAVRAAALEAAEQGRKVTVVAARAMIAAARGTAGQAGRKTGRDEAADRHQAEDDTINKLAWEALNKLTEGASVRVGRLPDAEEDDDTARPWVVHVYPDGGDPPVPVASKDSLASALTLAAGLQPARACKECGWTGPVFDGYSRKQGNPLGRSFNCRKCETRRVGDSKKVRRGTATEDELRDRPSVPRPAGGPDFDSPAAPPAGTRTPPAG